jgi:hypothetical protein
VSETDDNIIKTMAICLVIVVIILTGTANIIDNYKTKERKLEKTGMYLLGNDIEYKCELTEKSKLILQKQKELEGLRR